MLYSGGLRMNSDNFAAITGCKYCLQFSETVIICLQFEQGFLFYCKQLYQLNHYLLSKLAKYIYIYISYTGMSFGLLAKN